MTNKLRMILQVGGKNVCMEKSISYIPSQGLIVYEPLYGKVGTVVYQDDHYVAVLEMTQSYDTTQIEMLTAAGWVEREIT